METIYLEGNQDPPVDFTGLAVYSDGTKEYYWYGLLHRVDGPAFEHSDGTKMWYFDGQLHRTDGPAIEWPDGRKVWYLKARQTTEKAVRAQYPVNQNNTTVNTCFSLLCNSLNARIFVN